MFNGKKLNKIHEDLNDLHTRKVILYADLDSMDYYLYVDAERTERIDGKSLMDLCLKGALLINPYPEDIFVCPISFEYDRDNGAVTVRARGASSGSEISFGSKERTFVN